MIQCVTLKKSFRLLPLRILACTIFFALGTYYAITVEDVVSGNSLTVDASLARPAIIVMLLLTAGVIVYAIINLEHTLILNFENREIHIYNWRSPLPKVYRMTSNNKLCVYRHPNKQDQFGVELLSVEDEEVYLYSSFACIWLVPKSQGEQLWQVAKSQGVAVEETPESFLDGC